MEQGEENRRKCKKCLLRDIDGNEYLKSIKRLIDGIDKAEKTPEKLYESRLTACRECDKLIEGTCAVCGCFVELRAAKKSGYCPDVKAKW